MENSDNIDSTVNNSRPNSTADDNEEDEKDVWLNLVGIAADPPDRHEKCEYCHRPQVVCWCRRHCLWLNWIDLQRFNTIG
ncbi:uncharacterized protein LOC129573880 [Sitodiplosis mosellana]|uniref:uncharacterized protein LOC129573880 n=1 Tax=Sitodiplosis mosellana TaxID=263140 RepID=UPI002443D10B|nr:uncharacterized protein LOC129573880 [Sitodiplosis mosellana]